MSIFKNRDTGDIVTAFGPVADNYAARLDYELVSDDREGAQDVAPQPDVLDEPDEPSQDPEDTEDSESEESQEPALADHSDNSRSTK